MWFAQSRVCGWACPPLSIITMGRTSSVGPLTLGWLEAHHLSDEQTEVAPTCSLEPSSTKPGRSQQMPTWTTDVWAGILRFGVVCNTVPPWQQMIGTTSTTLKTLWDRMKPSLLCVLAVPDMAYGTHCCCELSRVRLFWDLPDGSPPGSSVHGMIFQAIIWQWVAVPSSRGSSEPRDWTQASCTGKQILYHYDTREALMVHSRVTLTSWSWKEAFICFRRINI